MYPTDSLKTGSFSSKGMSIQGAGTTKQVLTKSNLSSALTSSKMMMALHKKCNSIVTTPISANNP